MVDVQILSGCLFYYDCKQNAAQLGQASFAPGNFRGVSAMQAVDAGCPLRGWMRSSTAR
jgi:hypothetical protein